MWEEEQRKKSKAKRHELWTVQDVFLGLFGLAALAALAIAGFKFAKWAVAMFF
jgi:hypothetical protein